MLIGKMPNHDDGIRDMLFQNIDVLRLVKMKGIKRVMQQLPKSETILDITPQLQA
jgi:hypothetical protein